MSRFGTVSGACGTSDGHPLVDRVDLVEQPAQQHGREFTVLGVRKMARTSRSQQPHIAHELVEFGPIARHVEGGALDPFSSAMACK